ncbi:MAG TPA: hypothetical protein VMD53_19825 [Rhizomicrobium sp.]|nr:hypothetical protein [Rhizomicrobium sp.]
MEKPVEIDRETSAQKRDLLGHFCFALHFAVMIYIVAGWLAPWRPALVFYLLFVPAIYMQWTVNRDTCILNNIEGFMRTGRWRNKEINPEEGAWLLTLATDITGLRISTFQINLLTYSVLVLVWLLALARLFWRV